MCVQFLTVWGTGEKGAEAWWSQGCRTLDDLRARSDLSTQQVCMHLTPALATRGSSLITSAPSQQRIPKQEV